MTRSRRVRYLGKRKCELCQRAGTEKNPLQAHHTDGNPANNIKENFLVVHMRVCHPFADFITQLYLLNGKKANRRIVLAAWTTLTWKEPGIEDILTRGS